MDIPTGLVGDQLIHTVNDRLRSVSAALQSFSSSSPISATPTIVQAFPNPVTTDLKMSGYRVVVLGDPKDPQDALNLRAADNRYALIGATGKATTAKAMAVTAATVTA